MSKADEIRQDIEETRCEMDQTLDQVEERMQPRHLLDEVLEYFQSDSSTSDGTTDKVRQVGKSLVRQIKDHPVPALLCGAGLAWLAFESFGEDEEDGRSSEVTALTTYHRPSGGTLRTYPGQYGTYAAWEEGYDWSEEDENAWRNKAKKKMEDIRKTLSDTAKPFSEKLSATAYQIGQLRGGKYEKASGNWRDLPEYSGSFVDARTGEPYDEDYGDEFFHPVEDLDYLSDYEWTEEEEQTWKNKAQHVMDSMQETLSSGQHSMQERFRSLASHLSSFAGDMQGRASHAGQSIRSGARHAAKSTRDSVRHAGEATREYAHKAKRTGAKAARQTQEQISHAVEEYPLAVGAACLGLGLAAGLLLPATRQEDRMMGDASDDFKHQAEETAHEVAKRGKRIAKETGKAAKEEAKRQGLTPKQLADRGEKVIEAATGEASDLGEKAEKVADRAAKTAKSQTKRETESVTG